MVHQGGGLLTELITSKLQRQPSACRTWSWARLPSASASAGNRPGHCHTSDLPGVAHAWHMRGTCVAHGNYSPTVSSWLAGKSERNGGL